MFVDYSALKCYEFQHISYNKKTKKGLPLQHRECFSFYLVMIAHAAVVLCQKTSIVSL